LVASSAALVLLLIDLKSCVKQWGDSQTGIRFFFGNFPSKSEGAGVGQNSLSICKEESQLLFALSLESDIFDLPSVRLPFNANVFDLFCEKDAEKAFCFHAEKKCPFCGKRISSEKCLSIFCQIFGRIPKPKYSQLYSRLS